MTSAVRFRGMRVAPIALSVVAVAVVAAGCFPNGEYPDTSLTVVTESCRTVNEVARPLQEMMWDAYLQGVQLRPETVSYALPGWNPPGIESCYRSLEGQQWWRNYYCFWGNCGMAAVPGTSVHGHGKAVDFQDQFGELTFDSPGYVYLANNAWRFGFFHPDWAEWWSPNAEAWHWEHS